MFVIQSVIYAYGNNYKYVHKFINSTFIKCAYVASYDISIVT